MSALADLRGFAPNRRAAPDFAPNLERLKSTRDAAGPLGLTLVPAEARGLDALEQAFATMIGERAQALTVLSDGGAVQLSSHSGRRSDRIEPLFAAVHESAVGTFETCPPIPRMSVHRGIVLKNSKIAGLRKSRKCSALAISAAARLCRIDMSASDRFCGN
jgi:hypothetical protein